MCCFYANNELIQTSEKYYKAVLKVSLNKLKYLIHPKIKKVIKSVFSLIKLIANVGT